MSLMLKAGTSWPETWARCRAAAPEAFAEDHLLNLVGGEWAAYGTARAHVSPLDGTVLPGPSQMTSGAAKQAVSGAVRQHREWSRTPLAERRVRVDAALDDLAGHRDLLALLLMWEIGKTWASACADVDRAFSGVRWYLDEIERQTHGRRPLDGPVSNVASWNYPLSVLVHAELVQLLAGNAVVAKTPSKGGFHALTLAHAVMHRHGLPVSLVSGPGELLGEALICHEGVAAFAYVGGRENARKMAPALDSMARVGQRHILETEGLNAWGVWDFSQWDVLAGHLRKGFEYGKQRCTAYPRYVVQRSLFPDFLETYLDAVRGLTFGHPLAVEDPDDPFPALDFGPLINGAKVAELERAFADAVRLGGTPLVRGSLDRGRFLDGQDTSAYFAPSAVLGPPTAWSLHHREPFGPLDSIVVVDTEHELVNAMNASNGALVASVASDDLDFAARVSEELLAFKTGVNTPRSRGDREEVFGGMGRSWRGSFVGGDLLVDAVTQPAGEADALVAAGYGNFGTFASYPPQRTA